MKEILLVATTSAAADLTTPQVDLGDLTTFSIHVAFTGTNVVGSLALESSLDNVNWNLIADSTQAVTASTDHVWNTSGAGYRYVRVTWDYTSGTGNILIRFFAKEPLAKG